MVACSGTSVTSCFLRFANFTAPELLSPVPAALASDTPALAAPMLAVY
jgi:hypothetical protein